MDEIYLKDLFDIRRGTRLTVANRIKGNRPLVTAGYENTGVAECIGNENQEIFPASTITIDMFGNTFYRGYEYSADDNILVLFSKNEISNKAKMFIVSVINKTLYSKFSYGKQFRMGSFLETKIILPTKNGEIDFEFMENFIAELDAQRIAELDAQRIAELDAYLTITGLRNYTLTDNEKSALERFNIVGGGKSLIFKEFLIGDLFERLKSKKLHYKAEDLPKEVTEKYDLPCLTSSFRNQGLNYFVPREGATILKNVISIPSNSDVYRAYFQSREFTILSDAYAIDWKNKETEKTSKHFLFTIMCINKVTDLPIYSYKNKLGGWNVVQNKNISLPTKNGEIDFEFMETFISAIQKLVIKDVVLYADRKIEATKQIISKKSIL